MRSISTLLGLCLLLACGDSGSTETNAALSVTLPTNPIASGTTVQASIANASASSVTWSSSNSAIASVSSSGLITGTLKGKATITATSGSKTGQVEVTVVPGAPKSITIFSGDGQARPKGSQLLEPLCTNVKDAAGNLIIGATVTYAIVTGGGAIAFPTAPVTDPSGIAISGLWTLGPAAGTQTVIASSTGAGSVTFTATAQ